MVKTDVVGLYPIIPHDAGLEALRKALDNGENKKISTDNLTKMGEFVLKNNCFECNGKVKKTAIADCHCYQICASIHMYIYGPIS